MTTKGKKPTQQDDTGNSSSRREFIQGAICMAALPAAASAQGPEEPAAPKKPPAPGSLDGIDPKNAVDEYRSRRLDRLSDRELLRAVGDIVSVPCRGLTSFTLHAPLELLARAGLLPAIAPVDRELARVQMVASAAAYQAGVQTLPKPPPIKSFPDFDTATTELANVFQNGDEDGLEAVVLQMARQFGLSSLVHALTPALLPTLTAASHSHIGLWLLLRHGGAGDPLDARLLRPAARMLAADPKARLSSFSGLDIHGSKKLAKSPAEIEKEVLAKLADPPKGESPTRGGIRGLMEAGEKPGTANTLFGDFIRRDLSGEQIDAAFRSVLRMTAHSMLQDDLGQAKFGWSHCLTLPQAACGLSSFNLNRKLGLATTMVWATSYRTILSKRALDFDYQPKPVEASLHEALHSGPEVAASRFWHADPSEIGEMRRILASEAAVRNDQHLAKYTRACFDMCGFDPEHWRLYMAGAAKLCGLWIAETPREKIPDHFLDGRSTPG